MYKNHPLEEQDLFSSDTDHETLSSDDESASSTIEVEDVVPITPLKLHPIMSFMKKVFKEEVNDLADDFKLLTIGIHAIMLQAGFICFDPDSGKKIEGFRLPSRRNQNTSSTRYLCYTLPQLLELGFIAVKRVVLRVHDSGDLVIIHGSSSDKESDAESAGHQLSLKLNWFVIPLDLAFVNCDMIDARMQIHGSSSDQYPENEILEFHRLVNDTLVYPLLIDLHERSGLVPPACFMRLPVEIKYKIVGLLQGVDIARMSCVCSELRSLTSDEDLWKRKSREEFRFRGRPTSATWKSIYEAFWNIKEKRRPGRWIESLRSRVSMSDLLSLYNRSP